MRRTSIKTYFLLILIPTLLLIFGCNFKELEVWKMKIARTTTKGQLTQSSQHSAISLRNQQQQQHIESNENAVLDDGDGDGGDDDDDDDDNNNTGNADNINEKQHKGGKAILSQTTTLKSVMASVAQQNQNQQQQQQQQHEETQSEGDEATELEQKSSGGNSIAGAAAPPAPAPVAPISIHGGLGHTVSTSKSWFFHNGEYYPRPAQTYRTRKERKRHAPKLFPHQDPHSDRIVNQLMYVPHNYEKIRESGKLKTILLYNGLGPWNVKRGRDVFLRSKCPVDTCELTANRNLASSADMILYKDHFIPAGVRRPSNSKQVTMLYYLECPYHTQNVKVPDGLNWTATYRRDSDIVAPYEKWQYYDTKVRQAEQDHNYATNKTKKVAWFVSNCGARNGRLQYAHDLQKHIEVDIYGACGNYKCSRSTADRCFEILDRDYKFYLAFENSNCKDYITEKFFVNALNRNVLPIVMGARPEDYEVSAPHRSYIHVDEFASPKELAEYLNILDKDDELYNSYFKWKGTGEFINTFYWCRVCASLHNEEALRKPRWYRDLNEWWRGTGVCTNGSWRNYKARKDVITDD